MTTLVLKYFHRHCHLRKRQRPEAENAEEENVESPEKDDQRVEVVVEAGEDKGLDCFAYMEGGGDSTEKIGGHLKILKPSDGDDGDNGDNGDDGDDSDDGDDVVSVLQML